MTGQRGTGNWSHCRWCAAHNQYHGELYPCETYPTETLAEIQAGDERWRANLADPEWCERQVKAGYPWYAIAVFRALAGVN